MTEQISDIFEKYQTGTLSRRDFIHKVALLSAGLSAGQLLSACTSVAVTPESDVVMTELEGLEFVVPTLRPSEFDYQGYNTIPPEDKRVFKHTNPDGSPITETTSRTLNYNSFTWMCEACHRNFFSQADLLNHVLEQHTKRMPEVKQIEKPIYSQFIVGPVPRFDERNTIFNRTIWDPNYQKMVGEAAGRMKKNPWINQETRAWTAGAIYVDNKAGNLNEGYTGYDGRVRGAGGLYDWDEPVNQTKFEVDDPQWMTDRVKEVAKFFGADLVGITKVDKRWVYSNYYEYSTQKVGPDSANYQFAIVLGIEMDWDAIKDSPGSIAQAGASLAYSQMAEITAKLAAYIRFLGYPAVPSGNDTAQNIPLAIDAGLGEHGRNGLLLTPEYGARQRLCKVFTDLPLIPDKPIDFGALNYCKQCHACASSCPAIAIMMENELTEVPTSISNRIGIKRWVVNVEKCFQFWIENEGVSCGNCIASCPWSLDNNRDWLELYA
ncbi:MAG: reductive dehalogenase [Anaerolineaceae bacterium]